MLNKRCLALIVVLGLAACGGGDSTGPSKTSVQGAWDVSLVESWDWATPAQITSVAYPGIGVVVGSPTATQMTVTAQGQSLVEGFAIHGDTLYEYANDGTLFLWKITRGSQKMTWTALYDACDPSGCGLRFSMVRVGS